MSLRQPGRAIDARLAAGIFLVSVSTLTLELALTRVLSVRLWYHFGFLVISTALLGFGVAGVSAAVASREDGEEALERSLWRSSMGFGALALVTLPGLLLIPFRPFELFSDPWQLVYLPLYYGLLASPFFCSGLVISRILMARSRDASFMYAADLVGAGLGCVAIAWVVPTFGGLGAVALAGALGFVTAACLSRGRRRLISACASIAAIAVSFVLARMPPPKAPPGSEFMSARWNTFSYVIEARRTDPRPRKPGSPPPKLTRGFVIDMGAAFTGIPESFGGFARVDPDSVQDMPTPALALLGRQGGRALVIGSGAGREVRDLLWAGAALVDAVEINDLITDAVRADVKGAYGGLFRDPRVRLHTEEGRSFVRRSSDIYDAILSIHTISNAALASGALGLAENHTLTLEAFEDYLDHLSDDGVLFLTRPESQIPRLFSTARAAFERRGVSGAWTHLFAFRVADAPAPPKDALWFGAGFVLKKSPLTRDDLEMLRHELVPRGPYEFVAEELYLPDTATVAPDARSIYEQIILSPDVEEVYRQSESEIRPSTDDRPFFNHHTRWSKLSLSNLTSVFRLADRRETRMALENRPVAEVVLVATLVETALAALVSIGIPLRRASRRGRGVAAPGRTIAYFGMLGLAFIFLELALISKFSLFLGQPVHAMAVVLASLLLFTGLGSYLSGRIGEPPRVAALVACLVVAASIGFVPPVLSAFLGSSLPVRIAVAILALVPIGLALGAPFPRGLSAVGGDAEQAVAWAFGINAFFTVLGTVLALIIGMAVGFLAVSITAALCYLVAAVAAPAGRPDE